MPVFTESLQVIVRLKIWTSAKNSTATVARKKRLHTQVSPPSPVAGKTTPQSRTLTLFFTPQSCSEQAIGMQNIHIHILHKASASPPAIRRHTRQLPFSSSTGSHFHTEGEGCVRLLLAGNKPTSVNAMFSYSMSGKHKDAQCATLYGWPYRRGHCQTNPWPILLAESGWRCNILTKAKL